MKRLEARAEELLDEIQYYASQVNAVGTVLVDLIQAKLEYPDFIAQVADTYRLLTYDLVDVYHAWKRVLHRAGQGLGAPGPRIPLEALVTAFTTLRNVAEEADSRAEKMSHHATREAKMARNTADQLITLAENAAKILVSEAHKAGEWTVEWERKLGLRRWLR